MNIVQSKKYYFKVSNFALRKPLEKQTRITEDYCQKSIKAIENRLKKEPKTKQTNKQTLTHRSKINHRFVSKRLFI